MGADTKIVKGTSALIVAGTDIAGLEYVGIIENLVAAVFWQRANTQSVQ